LWIGTRKGLSFYDYKLNKFVPFTLKTPLLDQNIYQMLEDKNSDLWLATGRELAKLNRNTHEIISFDEGDGINIYPELLYTDSKGNLFVSAKFSGFYKFHPDKIKRNAVIPQVIINGLSVMNKPVLVEPDNEDAILREHISVTKEIRLNHNQSVVEFELTALNYTLSEKNQLAYKLEGFDKDWIYTSTPKRFVTYTNLSPGSYTLKVMGSNNDGVWNKNVTSLDVVILPPFWLTFWAFLFYFSVIAFALYTYRRYYMTRFEEKAKAEMSDLKLRFFTNISHEFRTPLTLILGPLNKLMTDIQSANIGKERLQEQFSLMERNANRLLLLVNQLLDLQKSGHGKLKLEPVYADFVPFLQSVYNSFEPLAKQRDIRYQFQTSVNELNANFDIDKMEKIVNNLLSNAFKFTKNQITLHVDVQDENLCIVVEDNGIGIATDKLALIFEEFYQIDNSNARKNDGSGIGLSLTRELVMLHGGTIGAESIEDEGTKIKVIIPVNTEPADTANYEPAIEPKGLAEVEKPLAIQNDLSVDDANFALPTNQQPLVLVVEDNADLRFYIRDVLRSTYRVIEAENGQIGFEKAIGLLPDLILSDIMMPIMDGIELCGMLKTDVRSSHIPVILLTAFSAIDTQLKGLKTGADDYLTKPFHADILLARIENLIESRRKLQLKFQHAIAVGVPNVVSNDLDDKLLTKAIALVTANIENKNFDIQQFVDEMGLSRTGLYVKLKALTGQSVSEFITAIRLQKASVLLRTTQLNISEVYYKVGFQNRSHFNESFKNQYGMTPSEFIQKNRQSYPQ